METKQIKVTKTVVYDVDLPEQARRDSVWFRTEGKSINYPQKMGVVRI
jgi:hypothetical protein